MQLEDGSLPLLAPMSEVAGRLAVQVGGWCLQAQNGGDGVLLSGAPGVRPGKIVIVGGGIAGFNACRVAAGVGASVTILDVNPVRLRYLSDLLSGQAITVMSNRATLEKELRQADLVIGTVLLPGARAPRLITSKMIASMKRAPALVDLSIDQGGISETSRATTHAKPIYFIPAWCTIGCQYAAWSAYFDLRADERDALVRSRNRRSRPARSGREQRRTSRGAQHL